MFRTVQGHQIIGTGTMANQAAWVESCRIDEARDKEWFDQHQGEFQRDRPPKRTRTIGIGPR